MMKSTEDAISKIPIMKCDGRQNLDFAASNKSFATSMGQRYCELAQVYKTGEAFTYTAPIALIALDSPFGTHICSPLRLRYIPYFYFPYSCIAIISYLRYSVFTVFLISCFFTLKFLALIPTWTRSTNFKHHHDL